MPEAAAGFEAFAQAAFVRACTLDVVVRKPGNVSIASPGHRMQAAQFVASAGAAAVPLCRIGARLGARVEAAVDASWDAAGCNTNLGIVLLAAPLVMAAEALARAAAPPGTAGLRAGVAAVLAALDGDDAAAVFRAIARANPGGLGRVPEADVHAPPAIGLREAMALAAGRDTIARAYADGFAGLFDTALPALPCGFDPMATAEPADEAVAVQTLYLALLAAWPDSHIVRRHGEAVAHSVLAAAQRWQGVDAARRAADPAFVAWDETLKSEGVNPGTTADFTVATLLAAALAAGPRRGMPAWHGT